MWRVDGEAGVSYRLAAALAAIRVAEKDKDQAKAKAEALLQEIRKNPAAFADLAKKNSDDPGSAAKGGDRGFFGRGMMVKPFEDATFTLKDGEISGVVESDFGFHIIKLTGIHAAKEKPFAEVKGEIEAELKKAAASRKFAEAAASAPAAAPAAAPALPAASSGLSAGDISKGMGLK